MNVPVTRKPACRRAQVRSIWNLEAQNCKLLRRPLQGGTVFFQQLADPKTALQSLIEMHLSMFKKEECYCSRPLAPQFQCCWKQPQKSHHPNRKAHSHQKSPSAWTTLKLEGAREDLSSNPTYITMLGPHYLSIVQSLSNRSKPQAPIFPKPGKGGQFQSSGREINEEWDLHAYGSDGWANVEMIGSRLATQTLHT